MNTVGTYLKNIRENIGLQLQDVHKKTNIDLTLLSRIENGKRQPTKEQVLQLAKFYNCDEHAILVQWLSDRLVAEVQEEYYALEALRVAESTIIYGQPISIFSDLSTQKLIKLESRRYIGNKAKLTDWILDTILKETENATSFLDIFAGTASVAKASFEYFDRVIINDILHSNNIIYKAFFGIGDWDIKKVEKILHGYNVLDTNDLDDNYFSTNFGDKFFDSKSAKLIGHIREDLEQRKKELTEKEFCIILASLIYSIDKIANTVGHFDAYIKKPIRYNKLQIRLIQPINFSGIEIHQENANFLAKKISADIVYIDPPYNSRQYSRFYHIYENIVTWEKPPLFGVALKPKAENMSVYCTVGAKKAFQDLVDSLDAKYIVVSYNNTYNSKSTSSENKIKLEEIESILQAKGITKLFDCPHRYFNAGKTEFDNHKELLFITKVNDK